MSLLLTGRRKLLQKDFFLHTSFYTQRLLRTEAFAHRQFFDTGAFTNRKVKGEEACNVEAKYDPKNVPRRPALNAYSAETLSFYSLELHEQSQSALCLPRKVKLLWPLRNTCVFFSSFGMVVWGSKLLRLNQIKAFCYWKKLSFVLVSWWTPTQAWLSTLGRSNKLFFWTSIQPQGSLNNLYISPKFHWGIATMTGPLQ